MFTSVKRERGTFTQRLLRAAVSRPIQIAQSAWLRSMHRSPRRSVIAVWQFPRVKGGAYQAMIMSGPRRFVCSCQTISIDVQFL